MPKRATIGMNPLDTVIPKDEGTPAEQKPKPVEEPAGRRIAFTLRIPYDLADHIRRMAYWTPGLSINDVAETAFQEYVDRIEKERGEPFKPIEGKIKPGRKIRPL